MILFQCRCMDFLQPAGLEWCIQLFRLSMEFRHLEARNVQIEAHVKPRIISEFTGVANAKLESAIAVAKLVVMNGECVIQPQRPDGQIEAQTETPVVAVPVELIFKRISSDSADVIKDGKANSDAGFRLKNGDAVFG